ncbi:alpha/beta hydrolase family protein [Parachlamydia acanthamoebae]|uniref:alpha/beta hydrolase family protein n=1 Tax=Parachlamydia acanthamoebae TaxID=83552 RepID=UPI00075081C6|nr:alpha/beta fold hydrolase [Parachlamydia acanthamoebae]
MPNPHKKQVLIAPSGMEVSFRGPSLEEGPLPSVFYFALSKKDTLFVDPYNKPSTVWDALGIRVFAVDLPGHGDGFENREAMHYWAQALSQDPFFLEKFVASCGEIVDYLIEKNYTSSGAIGAAGLSRGGFIATQLAAQNTHVSSVLGFAPLTQLSCLTEYQEHAVIPFPQHHLDTLAHLLIDKNIRYYIGNRDLRVSTDACFQCIRTIADAAFEHGRRSPTAELVLFPSIGHKGHGTPPYIFEEGARWLAEKLTN